MKLAFVLTFLPFAAVAQDIVCDPNGPQIALNMCAQQDWDKADAELNQVYKLAVAAMQELDSYQEQEADKIGETSLRDAQHAWVTFREKACLAEAFTFHGGSAQPMIYGGCMARLTKTRVEDLKYIAGIER